MRKPKAKGKSKPYQHPATPETRAKLREGTMGRLIANGRIGPEHVTAANEIERVLNALCCRLFAKTGSYGERLDPSADADWPPALTRAWFRYKAWADKIDRPGVSVVVDVLIDNHTARRIDRANGWKSGTAQAILIDALEQYAVMAGWLRPKVLTFGG